MGAFIAIPIGPVPIVLQNMFVLLAGLILGPAWGTACVAVYLLVGLAGLPVFAGALPVSVNCSVQLVGICWDTSLPCC